MVAWTILLPAVKKSVGNSSLCWRKREYNEAFTTHRTYEMSMSLMKNPPWQFGNIQYTFTLTIFSQPFDNETDWYSFFTDLKRGRGSQSKPVRALISYDKAEQELPVSSDTKLPCRDWYHWYCQYNNMWLNYIYCTNLKISRHQNRENPSHGVIIERCDSDYVKMTEEPGRDWIPATSWWSHGG